MSGIILRYVAGAGGDTICYLLSLKNNVYMNIYGAGKLYKNGRTLLSHWYDKKLPELVKLAKLRPAHKQAFNADRRKLHKNISELIAKNKYFVLKSHYYNKSFDEEIKNLNLFETVDIGFDLNFLPFIVQANLYKTKIEQKNLAYEITLFDKTLKTIAEKLNTEQKKSLIMWLLAKQFSRNINEFGLNNSKIMCDDLFYNPKNIEKVLKEKDYEIDFETEFYSKWKKSNLKYLPSEKYQEYVRTKNYNYADQTLNLDERYILLALNGKNFKFLK